MMPHPRFPLIAKVPPTAKLSSICFAIALLLAAAASPARPAENGSSSSAGAAKNVLHVHLDGFRSNNGKAHCTLYNDPEAFPEHAERALKQAAAPISNAYAMIDFTGLAPGKYAVVCYHDENNNGKFDESALGMPKEGYCFSNHAKPTFEAPKFPECAFDYTGGEQSISMMMIY